MHAPQHFSPSALLEAAAAAGLAPPDGDWAAAAAALRQATADAVTLGHVVQVRTLI